MNLKPPISRLRILAILEGLSYILFDVTMPLKYILDMPGPNYFVGMTHSILFVLYVMLCLQNINIYRWNAKVSALALMASLVPFGTFVADARLFKPQAHEETPSH